jgi:hypothetical protein
MATTGQRVSDRLARDELGLELTPLDRALDGAHAWFARHSYVPTPKQERRVDENPR